MRDSAQAIRLDAGGHALAADWRPGRAGGAAVAPPHPEYGGRRDNPVVVTVATALADAGFATLAFDWRGVGGSDGRPTGDLAAADADFAAALAALARRGAGVPLVGAGYSFGAAAALRAANRVSRLVLVAPPVAMLGAAELRACARPVVVIVGDADQYAPAAAVAAAMPAREDARLEVLPGVDHFFTAAGAIDRLAHALRAALA